MHTGVEATPRDHLQRQLDEAVVAEGCPAGDRGCLQPSQLFHVGDERGHPGDGDAPSGVRHRVHAVDLERDDVAARRCLELGASRAAEDDAPVDEAVVDRQDHRNGALGDPDATKRRAGQQALALVRIEDLQAVAVDLNDPEGLRVCEGWDSHLYNIDVLPVSPLGPRAHSGRDQRPFKSIRRSVHARLMTCEGLPILVPIDLSGEADRAIPLAVRFSRATNSPIILFSWSYDVGEAAAARTYMQELANDLPGTVRVEVASTGERSPAPSIVAAAERAQATICMASHGRSGIGHAALGSVAEETLALARRPLILVGPNVTAERANGFGGVVACIDGSQLAAACLRPASEWAARLDVSLQLVRVVEPGNDASSLDDMHVYDTSCVDALDRVDVPQVKLLQGRAAPSIVSFASHGVDLIAVASHGRTGLSRAVLGSVAMRIVHAAKCPVLVVPASMPGLVT